MNLDDDDEKREKRNDFALIFSAFGDLRLFYYI